MKKTDKVHLQIETASHPGISGKKNEDRFGVTAILAGQEHKTPSVLAVLCDGIGGHRAGEVAAEMGVSIITETILVSEENQPLKAMNTAITRASKAIFEASAAEDGRRGMGATAAVVWVIGERLYTANLGDSRIYLLRNSHLVQLTTDHTWIQEALDAGIVTDDDRDSHPNAHVIRRYLGSKKTAQPDFRLWYFEGENDDDALDNQGLLLLPGDSILLCSDGLTDLVTDEEILSVLQDTPLEQAPQTLIDMANNRGGHDNTTIVLIGVPPTRDGRFTGVRKRRWLTGCLASLVLIALLVAASLWGLRWLGGGPININTETPPEAELILPEISETLYAITESPTILLTATLEQTSAVGAPNATITPWPTNTIAP